MKRQSNPDHNPTKERAPIEEPGKREDKMILQDEEYDSDLDVLEDYEMADMHAIRDILMIDPNDIEFRQRHAEDIEMDLAA